MSEFMDRPTLITRLHVNSIDEIANEMNPEKLQEFLMLVPSISNELHREIAEVFLNYSLSAHEALSQIVDRFVGQFPDEMKVFDLLLNMLGAIKKTGAKKSLSEDDHQDVLDKIRVITTMLVEIDKENTHWTTQHKWMVTVGGFSLLAAVIALWFRRSKKKER